MFTTRTNSHQHRETHDQHAEPMNADIEIRRRRLLGQACRQIAECGVLARPANDNRRRAADHRRTGEDGVRRTGGVFRSWGGITRLLLGGIGFTGQQSLVDEQVSTLDQPGVGGNEIACDQLDDVPGDQRINRQRDGRPITPNRGLNRHRSAQRLDGALGADFLNEVERDADRDDRCDDNKAGDVTGRGGQSARHEENDDQRIAETGDEFHPPRSPFDRGRIVRSVFFRPRFNPGRIETRRTRPQPTEKW
jgi:hypothetical protein